MKDKNENEQKYFNNFYKAVINLKTKEDCRIFFEDVCTIKETREMIHRLEVARLLSEGVVFNEITKITGSSAATISRVNKCLLYGPGGYKAAIKNIKGKKRGRKSAEEIEEARKARRSTLSYGKHGSGED